MAELAFFPLAIDAYLADCGHLSDAEHGRYLRILMEMWRAPKQRLPNDDTWLARRFRRSVEEVQAELRPLISEFCQTDGNWLTQKRLSKEFAYTIKKSKKQSVRAKARWNKDKVASRGNAHRHASGNAPTPTPTPTPTPKEDVTTSVTEVSGALAASGSPPRAKEPTGTRLPKDWKPEDGLREWTIDLIRDEASGVSAGHELEKFRDYWSAQPGAKGRKADWPATWRNWIRKAIDMEANGHGKIGSRPEGRTADVGSPTVADGISAAFARRYVPT